jgi:hypothetical protein
MGHGDGDPARGSGVRTKRSGRGHFNSLKGALQSVTATGKPAGISSVLFQKQFSAHKVLNISWGTARRAPTIFFNSGNPSLPLGDISFSAKTGHIAHPAYRSAR